ncbi:hypothetical protein Tco_0707170 [Tanacetum coccineum]|uniref:Uncharacterized protein n=1 Tax=Tanacetum coccineum TaxID=301880 RepID=A0ABQ4Y9F8_9ASTR
MPPEDEVLPAEERPLPAAVSPTVDSLGYVPESDPMEDLEEDEMMRTCGGSYDYLPDREETIAMMMMIVALPAVDHALSAEETESFETDESAATPPPHPAYRVTTRISIRDEALHYSWSDTEFVASMFGEVHGEGASLSIEVEEEEALAISGGSRFAVKMGGRYSTWRSSSRIPNGMDSISWRHYSSRKDTVMSDSEDSTVTYTAVSSPFADLPDIGSPGVDGPPVMPEDPYAYVVAAFQAPPSPDYRMRYSQAEEQPLPAAVSPIADSLGYVPESDPEEDPEEDDDEDPEEDPADYPADGGDDGDDKDESSDDEDDDDVDIVGRIRRRSTQLLAESTTIALPGVDYYDLLLGRLSRMRPTSLCHTITIMFTSLLLGYRSGWIHLHHFWSVTEVARLLLTYSNNLSPLSLWSSQLLRFLLHHYTLVLYQLTVSSQYLQSIRSLGYRAAMIWLRAEAPSNFPITTITTTHHTLNTVQRSVEQNPRLPYRPQKSLVALLADYGFVATMDREIMRDLERDVSYWITDTWDEMLVDMPGAPATDDTELGQRMTEFTTRVRQDTDEIYTRLDDEQSERELMAGWLNMLYRDRCAHARTARLMEAEARMSREAWGRSMYASVLALKYGDISGITLVHL